TRMQEYANVRRNGLIAINLQEGDELLWVAPTSGEDDILLASQQGKAIRFHEREVRAMGRDTQGVIGMKLGRNDLVAGMAVLKPGADLLVLSERGFGKRTPIAEYPTHHRGGQGVFTLKVTDKVGRLAALRVPDAEEEARLREEAGRSSEPQRRLLRWLRHPLVGALWASYRIRRRRRRARAALPPP